MALTFTPATKKALKARIALEGPSGSGKTYTGLLTARALGNRIAVVDTEKRSASLYADLFAFDTLELDRYAPEVLIEALAAAAGHDVCLVDSFSHFWMGQDGMLEQVDRAAKRSGGGNTFAGWKDLRPVERKMIDAMLAYPGHLIVTLRTKSEWVVEENDRGKKVPKKIGLKAEQREGLEYEFTVVGTLDLENTLVVTKSRCPALAGAVIPRPDEGFGRTLANWLDAGESAGESAAQLRDEILANPTADRDDFLAYHRRAREAGLLGTAIVDGHGDATTLGEFIVAAGKAVAQPAGSPPPPAAPGPDDLEPRDPDGDPPAADAVTQVQHKAMHAHWGRLGLGGQDLRGSRLEETSRIIGRQITSSSELTRLEAETVITALESRPTPRKATPPTAPPAAAMTQPQRQQLFALMKERVGTDPAAGLAAVNTAIAPARVATSKELTEFQAAQVIGHLQGLPALAGVS